MGFSQGGNLDARVAALERQVQVKNEPKFETKQEVKHDSEGAMENVSLVEISDDDDKQDETSNFINTHQI